MPFFFFGESALLCGCFCGLLLMGIFVVLCIG